MVTPQALLGVAVGSLLLLIGGYALWLDHRLRQLEAGHGSTSSSENIKSGDA